MVLHNVELELLGVFSHEKPPNWCPTFGVQFTIATRLWIGLLLLLLGDESETRTWKMSGAEKDDCDRREPTTPRILCRKK